VSHCPFCGKGLLPFFKRLWFWLIVAALSAAATVTTVFLVPLVPLAPPSEVGQEFPAPAPAVIGAPPATPARDLAVGTTVDCNSLLVTVIDVSQELTSSDGQALTGIEVQFVNKGQAETMLYSTQWQLETTDGSRHDRYIGKTAEGQSVDAGPNSQSLAPGETRSVEMLFATEEPARAIYAPDALSYNEDSLVTWRIEDASLSQSVAQQQ
jgi:hypothetical protein